VAGGVTLPAPSPRTAAPCAKAQNVFALPKLLISGSGASGRVNLTTGLTDVKTKRHCQKVDASLHRRIAPAFDDEHK
jgi:hypothetical protein